MFEKFGEFDSVEELNKAAVGFKSENDTESILELAKENGIDEDDAQDYIDGVNTEFATLSMAAFGRIDLERKEEIKDASGKMAMEVIFAMIMTIIMEEDIQEGIMKKGKRAKDILSGIRQEASKHKSGNMGVSCGTDKQLKDIIRTYYTKSREAFETKIAELYR